MPGVDWDALASAGIGAVLALSGTLLADVRKDRRQRDRDRVLDQRRYCVAFTVALTESLGGLRSAVAVSDPADRRAATVSAMEQLYVAREQLLLSGTAPLVVAGEDAFHRLVDVRDAVRSGAALDSIPYHEAYHAFSDAIWRFRIAVRADLHEPDLDPGALDRPDWSDRDRCTVCAAKP